MTKKAPKPNVIHAIEKNMPGIESALIEWSSTGRVKGHVSSNPPESGLPKRPAPSLVKPLGRAKVPPKPPSAFPELEKAVRAAVKEAEATVQQSMTADGRLKRAQAAMAALDDPAAKKKKSKKGEMSPDEMRAALEQAEAAASECRAAADAARSAARTAESVLARAVADEAEKARLLESAKLEARLRSLHVKATGRNLPCRLPHVLADAAEQVRASSLPLVTRGMPSSPFFPR